MCGRSNYLVILMAILALATTASADLVGHWWLDEGSGTVAYDSSGNGNDGTLIGGPQPGEQGILFDGVDDWIDLGNPAQLPAGASPRSICAWAMTQSVDTGWRVVVGYGSPAGSQSNGFAQNGTLLSGFGYGNDLQVDNFFEIGQWYHLCLTYDGTTAVLYANGVELMSQAKTWNLVPLVARIGRQVNEAAEFWSGGIYDVRIYDHVLTPTEIQQIMVGSPALSEKPDPENEATDVLRDVVLGWDAGDFAVTHDVYFGAAFDDVNDATRDNPLGVLFSQGQTDRTFDPPGVLQFGQTYYWRVDEVNGAPDYTIYKGNVWSFTVEPFARTIDTVVATTNGTSEAETVPENLVNGAGLNADDQHSTDSEDMWLGAPVGNEPLYVEFAFDRVYKLHEMLIWNYNVQFETFLGFSAKDVTVEYSEDGIDWTALGDFELAQGLGMNTYAYNTTIGLEGVAAQYVRMTINNSWNATSQSHGLSEVRFMYIPAHAREPEPADGAVDVALDTTLSWRAGREAASHVVNLSKDPNALVEVATTTVNSYSPALDLDATYYWQVDEVNDAEAISLWAGDVWSFTTQEYLVIDDFDAYNDDIEAGTTIWQSWIDGIDDPSHGGAVVGNATSPFAEQIIVRSGQSLNFSYDNQSASAFSEADRTLSPAQDWTAGGIKSLSLWFHGTVGNTGQLYVKINGTKINYDGDPADIGRAMWQPWNIDLTAAGVNVSSVSVLTVGVEGVGTGVVYFEDIRLYAKTPEYVIPAEPDSAKLVAHYALDGNANDSSGNGYDGTEQGDPVYNTGVVGQAVSLDGINAVIDCGDVPVGPDAAITVAFWVNPRNIGQDWAGYISKWTLDNSQRTFWIGQHSTDGWLRFGIYPNGPTVETALDTGQSILANDQWTHVVCTYDGNTQRIYAQGMEVASVPRNGAVLVDRGGNLRLGIVATSNFFDGLMDDVRIYQRAVSAEEAAWLAGRRMPVPKPF